MGLFIKQYLSSIAGYYGDGFNAIVVFAACYLPDKRRRDYHYVMDNLFLWVSNKQIINSQIHILLTIK